MQPLPYSTHPIAFTHMLVRGKHRATRCQSHRRTCRCCCTNRLLQTDSPTRSHQWQGCPHTPLALGGCSGEHTHRSINSRLQTGLPEPLAADRWHWTSRCHHRHCDSRATYGALCFTLLWLPLLTTLARVRACYLCSLGFWTEGGQCVGHCTDGGQTRNPNPIGGEPGLCAAEKDACHASSRVAWLYHSNGSKREPVAGEKNVQ